jgi:hypothetical protein
VDLCYPHVGSPQNGKPIPFQGLCAFFPDKSHISAAAPEVVSYPSWPRTPQ